MALAGVEGLARGDGEVRLALIAIALLVCATELHEIHKAIEARCSLQVSTPFHALIDTHEGQRDHA